MKRYFLAFVVGVSVLLTPVSAFGESVSGSTQADLMQVLTELQNSFLGKLAWSGSLGGSKCKPTYSATLFSLSLVYTASDTCPLSGKVALNLVPPSADIDLDVNNSASVNRVKYTAKFGIGYTPSTGFKLSMSYINGSVDIKSKQGTLMTMGLNGSSSLTFLKSAYNIQGRNNIYDSASGEGFALITQLVSSPATRRFDGCLLTGAVASDPNAGTIGGCTALLK